MIETRTQAILKLLLQSLGLATAAGLLGLLWTLWHPARLSRALDSAGVALCVLAGMFLYGALTSRDRQAEGLGLPWRLTLLLFMAAALLFGSELVLRSLGR